MAGHGIITEEIQFIKESMLFVNIVRYICMPSCCMHLDTGESTSDMMNSSSSTDSNPNTPAHCLRLPGGKLDLKALLKKISGTTWLQKGSSI